MSSVRSLSPLESVALLSVAGSVAAVFVPNFVRHLHASRLAEPLDGLRHIGAEATAFALQRPAEDAYPPPVGLTPKQVPPGESVEDPPGVWEHPTWRALGFAQPRPHYFSFAFDSERGASGSRFSARAHGDLDGDGQYSTFKLNGEYRVGESPVTYPLEMDREVE